MRLRKLFTVCLLCLLVVCLFINLVPQVNGVFDETAILTFNSGEDDVTWVTIGGSYLYACLYSTPAKVVKVDLSTFTEIATLTLDTGDDYALCEVISGSYLYVGLYTNPGKVVKIDLNTFTKVSTLTLSYPYVNAMVADGSFLYAGLSGYPGEISKVDLTTFTVNSTLTLSTGEDSVFSEAISGSYLYAGLGTAPCKIVKINLSTFTKTATLNLNTGENSSESLVVSGSYLYAHLNNNDINSVGVSKINLSTFTEDSYVSLSTNGDHAFATATDNIYLYAGCYTYSGKISRVTFNPLAEESILTLTYAERVRALTVNDYYLYAGLASTPGRIAKINIIPFATMALLQYNNNLTSQGLPYIQALTNTITMLNYSNSILKFTVDAPTETTSTTKVHVSDKGVPRDVWIENGTLAWSYNTSTKTLTLEATHLNPTVKIVVDWRILGDLDGDGSVDVDDLTGISTAYGSTPEKPTWDPDADLDRDRIINVLELFTVGLNYGKSGP